MQRLLAVTLAVIFLGMTVACGDSAGRPVRANEGAQVTPTVSPGNSSLSGNPIGTQPGDVQRLPIGIADGKFSHDRFDAQTGSIRLVVADSKGPYQFSIDGLLQPVTLPESGEVEIGVTVSSPGSYQMHVTRQGESQPADTAVLNIATPGNPQGVPQR